jgi:hypothetical protein
MQQQESPCWFNRWPHLIISRDDFFNFHKEKLLFHIPPLIFNLSPPQKEKAGDIEIDFAHASIILD